MIISVSGGKGGTGKSTVTVNIAILLAQKYSLVLADLDVEVPNDHILLSVKPENREPINIMLPFVDYKKCIKCRACGNVCDTGAMLLSPEGIPYVIPRLCSGCRTCYYVCPTKAIEEGKRTIGYTYLTNVDMDGISFKLVSGKLIEGEEHTPPAVIAAKERALNIDAEIHLIDTSAGTSNTVATALDNSKIVLAVTEPTPLGLHDLELILKLTSLMKIKTFIVINRAGIGPEDDHVKLSRQYGSEIIARIPYSRDVVESYIKGKPIVLYKKDSKISQIFYDIVNYLEEVVNDD